MLRGIEMDDRVGLADQLAGEVGPVILVNTFRVAAEDVDRLLEARTADAAHLETEPGFISTQLHRGIAGSRVFVNYAVWESVAHFREALGRPEFQEALKNYPPSAVGSPHLFEKVAVPNICVA